MKQISLLAFSFVFLACSKHSDHWTRPHSEQGTGIIIAGVEEQRLDRFLQSKNLHARVLSRDRKVFEIDPTDVRELKASFPNAMFIRNRVIQNTEPLADQSLHLRLTPEAARKIAAHQLEWLGLDEAHKHSLGDGVVVAVIDTGVTPDRWDLKDSMWTNPGEIPGNEIDDDHNGLVDDVYGWNFSDQNADVHDTFPHGTMSAGVIASSVTGIAPHAKIMAVRVASNAGVGTIADITEGFLYAQAMHADIINYSMGVYSLTKEEEAFFESLSATKVFIAASAGNFSQSCRESEYNRALAKMDNIALVGAMTLATDEPRLASYSSYGSCVQIAAPAGLSAEGQGFARGIVTSDPTDQHTFFLYSGTSAAAPVVSGVAALVKSLHPEMTGAEIKAHLLNSAVTVPELKGKIAGGAMVSAVRAVTGN